MTSAAFFLITRVLKNRIVRSLRRLRQPRYIVGALVAILYFWSILFRKGAVQVGVQLRYGPGNEIMTMVMSLLVLIVLIAPWIAFSDAPGLVFSEAEIQFFFAGPVSRRQLFAYKVIRSQVQTLVTATIMSLFAIRGSHILGVWLAFAVLDVYFTFVSFVRARLKLAGIGWGWRMGAVAIFVAIVGAVVNQQIRANKQLIVDALQKPHGPSVLTALRNVLGVPPLGTVLYLPRLFAQAVYSAEPFQAAAIVALFGLSLFFLTTQLDVSFEDASIVASQRALTRRARMRAMRSGRTSSAVNRMPPPFRLKEGGRPEVAVFWKNLVASLRISSMPLFGVVLPLAAFAAASIFHKSAAVPDLVGIMGLMATAMLIFIGPQALRTDLRTDILRLDVIKAFPLTAESLVAAELAAPLVILSIFEFLMLIVSVSALRFGRHYFEIFTMPEFVVSALVFVIPIVAIQLLIQNTAIVMFPAWALTGGDGRGFAVLGQRLLMLLGNVLALVVALIPPLIVFAPGFWLVHKLFHGLPIGILAATIPPVAVLVLEIFLGLKFLAGQFEDIDMANDLEAVSE